MGAQSTGIQPKPWGRFLGPNGSGGGGGGGGSENAEEIRHALENYTQFLVKDIKQMTVVKRALERKAGARTKGLVCTIRI